jgi:Flp pilus assembly protein TadG
MERKRPDPGTNPQTPAQTAAGRVCRFFRREDGGQAMAEACVVIPVLLMLFLGLWQHSLAQMAQTRAELAARHVAWARAVLGKGEKDAKDYAAKFFPSGTTLDITQDGSASYSDYGNNLTGICTSLFPIKGGGKGQYKATVAATVPALPVAAPKSPGKQGEQGGAWDYLASVKTHGATVVWNNSEEQPANYTFPLLLFIFARPELLVELVGHIALSEIFAYLMSSLSEAIGQSGWFADIMEKLHLDFMGDLFNQMVETFLWLVNDLIEIIKKYA